MVMTVEVETISDGYEYKQGQGGEYGSCRPSFGR